MRAAETRTGRCTVHPGRGATARAAGAAAALAGAGAAAALATLAIGCGGDRPADHAPAPAAGEEAGHHAGEQATEHREGVVELSAAKLAVIDLATAPVERRRLAAQLETTGEVGYEEDRIAHVAPRVPGRVQRVEASLGDEVRPCQLLAVLDSVELGQAKAAYRAARTREELAQRSYQRESALYEDRITSEREMLEARAAYEEAVAMRQASRETLRLYGVPAGELEELGPEDPAPRCCRSTPRSPGG